MTERPFPPEQPLLENPENIIELFFRNLASLPEMNREAADILREHYFAGKFTPINLSNALRGQREKKAESGDED